MSLLLPEIVANMEITEYLVLPFCNSNSKLNAINLTIYRSGIGNINAKLHLIYSTLNVEEIFKS